MNKFYKSLLWLLGLTLISRLLAMLVLPLVETTEPRYAEIARLMAASNDWITPWFSPGVPFWGKPPLSFWSQALAIKLFGGSEFAVRLPGLLIGLATIALIYHLAQTLAGRRAALISALIFATSALGFAMSGAVLTDPFLCFSLTFAWAGVIHTQRQGPELKSSLWRYALFIGAALGLLAKGPVAIVLLAPPVGLWLLMQGWPLIRRFPWFSGTALMLALSLPWYIAAELKTPGFLDYFIVGEHIKRFVDSGWQGDLYGKAHDYPRGSIWLFALWATFPWCLAPLALLVAKLKGRGQGFNFDRRSPLTLLVMSTLWPLIFFSVAGNILWTYVLPSLPGFAVLLAIALCRWAEGQQNQDQQFEQHPLWSSAGASDRASRWTLALASVTPILGLLTTLSYGMFNLETQLNTEKSLIEYAQAHNPKADVYYLGAVPFSARYYSGGKVLSVTRDQLQALLDDPALRNGYIAIPKRRRRGDGLRIEDFALPQRSNSRYALYEFEALWAGQLDQGGGQAEVISSPDQQASLSWPRG
ncbi:ArnT family glycosyltransferase [Spongiibacter marinus]|uniref:ArnT family glycosyltransferase n=1 Tax=Spongiibacter marinus TaxID=354246 RepID=UPI003C3857B6